MSPAARHGAAHRAGGAHVAGGGEAQPPIETATVDALTQAGEGVVHGGKTVFVAGALPGERIRYRRTRRHRQHDDGELLELLEPSAARAVPRCAHFGVCGGCALQHLAPEAQLQAKDGELRAALTRLARVTPASWLPPLSGPAWSYRRRARLGARFVHKKGLEVVGFRERRGRYVAQLARCEVLAAPAGELIAPLAAVLGTLDIREQLPQVEVAVADNATALVLRVLREPTPADLARLAAFGAAHGVRLYLQPQGLDSVRELGAPGEPLRYRLPDFALELEFEPTDFIQVNAAVNRALVARALELLAVRADAAVLDLYCGLGNFTLALARVAPRVVGVEGEPALIARARSNARRNGIANAEFHRADLASAPDPHSPWLRGSFTHVLLDPPRTGAHALLATLARLAPERLLYISCHPGSLARDLGVLVHEHGFTLAAAGVVDMFPHTTHVESLALLTAARSPALTSAAV